MNTATQAGAQGAWANAPVPTLPAPAGLAGYCWSCQQNPCVCANPGTPVDWSAGDTAETATEEDEEDFVDLESISVVIQRSLLTACIAFLSLCGMIIISTKELVRRQPLTLMHMLTYLVIVYGYLWDHHQKATLSMMYYETLARLDKRLDTFAKSDLGNLILVPYRPIQALAHLVMVIRARRAIRNEPYQGPNHLYITRIRHVADMVTQLANLPTDRPYIGFDLEANNLGPYSHLSLMQIRDYLNGVTYLVDLLVLQEGAWTSPGADGVTTLRTIFEDHQRKKLIFDCRQDSACLYAKAGIRLAGIMDCQYMHLVTMDSAPKTRPGLISTISNMGGLSEEELREWKRVKNSERSHGTWERRPIPPQAKAYAAGDVKLLQEVHQRATRMLVRRAMRIVHIFSAFEIQRTQVEPRKYVSTGRYTYDFFPEFWSRRLLRAGVESNSTPFVAEAPM